MGRVAEAWRKVWPRWARVAEPLFLWSGVVVLALGAGFWAHEWWLARHLVKTVATVTENESRMDDQGRVNYFPHLRFKDASGRIVQITSPVGSNPAEWNAAEQVPVMYAPGDPTSATIATKGDVYAVAIVLGLLGTVLVDLGAVLWILKRWRAMPPVDPARRLARSRRGFGR